MANDLELPLGKGFVWSLLGRTLQIRSSFFPFRYNHTWACAACTSAGAVWPTSKPGAVWPTSKPGAVWPTSKPGAVWPTSKPGAVWPTSKPGAVWPTSKPGAVWPTSKPSAVWPTSKPMVPRPGVIAIPSNCCWDMRSVPRPARPGKPKPPRPASWSCGKAPKAAPCSCSAARSRAPAAKVPGSSGPLRSPKCFNGAVPPVTFLALKLMVPSFL